MQLGQRTIFLALFLTLWGGCADISITTAPAETCKNDGDCDPKDTCRTGTCSKGECSFTVKDEFCFVDGSCFNANGLHPNDFCQSCQPGLIQTGLIQAQCEAGQVCNKQTGECNLEDEDASDTDGLATDGSESDVGPSDVTEADTTSKDGEGQDALSETIEPLDAAGELVEPDVVEVAPTCAEYCELYLEICPDNVEVTDVAECFAFCEDFIEIPKGTLFDDSGNTVGCRLNALNEADCSAGSLSGGNVCGTWCENYCYLAFLNCADEEGYFETFNQCLLGCDMLPTNGDPGVANGDTVQCRIYHLSVAGDDKSGGAATHCPHGAIKAKNYCVSNGALPICETYCDLMMASCTGPNEEYESKGECMDVCSTFPATGSLGDSEGDTVQCRLYHAEWVLQDPDLHCPHAGKDGGGICVDEPAQPLGALKIVELGTGITVFGLPVTFIEFVNQSDAPIDTADLYLYVQGTSPAYQVFHLDVLGILEPSSRVVVSDIEMGDLLGAISTSVVFTQFGNQKAGVVALTDGYPGGIPTGIYDMIPYGDFTDEMASFAWYDWTSPTAVVPPPGGSISRCPENMDTDDGANFLETAASLGTINLCP